jgi:hypothetical protein
MSAEKIMNETTRMEWVTPEMAAEWLKHNTRNRALSDIRVAAIAAEIKAGSWRITHQGIAFGADGTLFDGQHRLSAIVAANIAVPLMVTRGLSHQALDAIDTGAMRAAADVLAIADGKHVGRVKRAAVLAAVTIMQNGGYRGKIERTTVASLREALSLFEHNFDALNLIMRSDRLAQAPVLGAMLICHALHPAIAVEFVSTYRDPSDASRDNPAIALRDHVLLNYARGTTATRTDVIARTFSAFHAYRHSMPRKHVKAAKGLMLDYINTWRTSRGMVPISAEISEASDKA